ncbi:MAG: phosphotransferase [Lewinellaceae bacterium]|nr:phosphotransferase [Lewinellaceae bacterium]
MTAEQIQSIIKGSRFPGPKAPVTLIETHISWVILTPAFAFKIKKPLQLAFLDFSTLEKRAFYCGEELRLNRRLASDMYLDVLPVCLTKDGQPEIRPAAKGEAPVDFAVAMKRMDNDRQMDKLLRRNGVTAGDIEALAKMLVRFHRSVVLSGNGVSDRAASNRDDFNDLFTLKKAAERLLGAGAGAQFDAWQQQVGTFLDKHRERLQQRAQAGFWVDGHGDLHARNIFLLPEGPLAFDCIEFSEHFRQGDILNELAFLCMDLDAGGHHELAEAFMTAYLREWPCIEGPEDALLFLYFKAYRANVRLKVALLESEQHRSTALEQTAQTYWALLKRYLGQLGSV